MKRTITVALALVGALGLLLAASGAGTPAFALSVTGAGTPPAKATSLAAFGGMSGLVKAAKKEGSLNVITLPRNW
ncbi:MAG: ABC transporter substrate-binding protein, partial [Actinobacteria bacterium]|nr:ABC transporter substrate-binding protein [Actinomycetota bacterium]